MSAPQIKCVHRWRIDSANHGVCSLCGIERQFKVEFAWGEGYGMRIPRNLQTKLISQGDRDYELRVRGRER